MRTARSLAVVLASGLLAACGGAASEAPEAPAVEEDGVEHIHGLGVNPADRSLVIATHSGLFRSPPGQQRAVRIGDRRQDTMGFTVVGPDRFLGSGHPDLRDDLPPLLGLIRSDDGGRTWRPVSLLGEADFHVLRAAGRRIYGVNSADGRLLASTDGGRSWRPRPSPGRLIDLAPHPTRSEVIVASGEDGLHVSRDGGGRWRPLVRGLAGLVAWPRPDALYVVDAHGSVHRSTDGGRRFAAVGEVGGQPAALAAHDDELYVALHTNEVRLSHDGGRSWRTRVAAGGPERGDR